MNARLPAIALGADCPSRRAREIGRHALHSLHAELRLYPKPGLVSLVDSGSHADMDAATFMRSLFSLRRYFCAIAAAGAAGAPLAALRCLGLAAEQRMLAATGGINTHRGAIFSLGLLCAAAGSLDSVGAAPDAPALRGALLRHWGAQLGAQPGAPDTRAPFSPNSPSSHGALMAARHGAGGARAEAAHGFPAVFEIALPALRRALAAGRSLELARIDALFSLMAAVDDTNVLYRGGRDGAALVRATARAFLDAGATADAHWRARALAAHRAFVARRLSPGGAADLLAAACFVHALTGGPAERGR